MDHDDFEDPASARLARMRRARWLAARSLSALDRSDRPLITERPDLFTSFRVWQIQQHQPALPPMQSPPDKPAPEPEPESSPPTVKSVSYAPSHQPHEAILPLLEVTEDQLLDSDLFRDRDEDEEVSGFEFTCCVCSQVAHRAYRMYDGELVCGSCRRFMARRLEDFPEVVVYRPADLNGEVRVSFDQRLAQIAPVAGRTLRPEETITPDMLAEWHALIASGQPTAEAVR